MFILKTEYNLRRKVYKDKGKCIFKRNGIIKIICRKYWPINISYMFIVIFIIHQCTKIINKYFLYKDNEKDKVR